MRPRRPRRRHRRRSRPGRCRSASSAAGSTTSSPPRAVLRRRRDPVQRALHLARRPRHLGRRRPRRRRAWIGCRRRGIPLPAFADAVAPGIVLAQAIGRWGNYFNQELYGRPDRPAVGARRSTPAHRPAGYAEHGTYHPTFLYELLWNLGVAGLVIWADRRFQLGKGRAFALYVAAYCVGRGWIEALRIDDGEPHPRAAAQRLDRAARVPRRGGLHRRQRPGLRPGRETPVRAGRHRRRDRRRGPATGALTTEDGRGSPGASKDGSRREHV